MNYRPLLKALALVVITWLIFLIARVSFRQHTEDHLVFVPEKADAVVILNSNNVGGKLFYQRVFNEDSYSDLVTIDEKVERELISDALGSGVDILGPIALFSYSENGIPVVGISVAVSDDNSFDQLITRYARRLALDSNVVFGTYNNAGIILYAENQDRRFLRRELKRIQKLHYGSASEQAWFEPLYSHDHDLIAYNDNRLSDYSMLNRFFKPFTPGVIKKSYTYMDLEDGKLSFVHEAFANMRIENLLSKPLNGGYDGSGGFHLDVHVNLDAYNRNTDTPFNLTVKAETPDTVIMLRLDSLLTGQLAFQFNGVKFSLTSNSTNGIPFDIKAELSAGVDTVYWFKYRDLLLKKGIMQRDGEILRIPMNPYLGIKSNMMVNIVEKPDRLLISLDKEIAEHPLFDESLEKDDNLVMTFNTSSIIENIRVPFAPDMSKLSDIQGGHVRIQSYTDKTIVLEGSLDFTRTNHSLVEALHIVTHLEEFLEPINVIIEGISFSGM